MDGAEKDKESGKQEEVSLEALAAGEGCSMCTFGGSHCQS